MLPSPPPAVRATLAKEALLRSAREFAHVREHGRKWVGRLMVLQVAPAPDGLTRVGLIVSKRVHRRAVRRNRARRLLRESFRLTQPLPGPPVWVVAIARANLLDSDQGRTQSEWLGLLRRAGQVPPPAPSAPPPSPAVSLPAGEAPPC